MVGRHKGETKAADHFADGRPLDPAELAQRTKLGSHLLALVAGHGRQMSRGHRLARIEKEPERRRHERRLPRCRLRDRWSALRHMASLRNVPLAVRNI
jgi:hypothetical protein